MTVPRDDKPTGLSGLPRVTRQIAPVRMQVLETLRSAIESLDLEPGTRLVEREICETTGASRTSVREALRQLESEGLVTNIPKKGPTVTVVGAVEAAEIYEVRALLEGRAARRFTERATPASVGELRSALEAMRDAVLLHQPGELLTAKAEFYRVLLEGAANDVITSILRSLHTRVTLLRATSMSKQGRPAEALAEIEAIVEAIENGDPDAAEAASIHHVQSAATTALASLEATTL